MRTIESRRPPSGADRDDVLALVSAVRDARGIEPLSENKAIALGKSDPDSVGFLLREDGELIGYAHLGRSSEGFTTEVVTGDEGKHSRVTSALLASVIFDLGGSGGGSLSYFLADPDDTDLTTAMAAGFTPSRELLVLRRASDPEDRPPPDGPPVAPFRVGVDEDAWIALNARAFPWHPEQGAWTRADLEDRERQVWFSSEGCLCAWVDGRLAGTCWTKVHDAPEHVGEIYVMSVDPDFQGIGLGRRLLAHGLAHLSAAGVPATILYVEGDNEAALGLYRSFGFTNAARTVVTTRQVAAQ